MPGQPIDFMQIKGVVDQISRSPEYRKKDKTGLRLAKEEEIGTLHLTHVLDKNTKEIYVETSNKFSNDLVVARNLNSIGLDANHQPIYNEWLIPVQTVKTNYGQEVYNDLTTSFQNYSKKVTIKAIPIDDELVDLFKSLEAVDEHGIHLKNCNITGRKGDYLTSAGYLISAHDWQGYELAPSESKPSSSPTEGQGFFDFSLGKTKREEPSDESPKQVQEVPTTSRTSMSLTNSPDSTSTE